MFTEEFKHKRRSINMVKEEGLMTTKPEVAVHYSRGTKKLAWPIQLKKFLTLGFEK
jgi:hypothetical protein